MCRHDDRIDMRGNHVSERREAYEELQWTENAIMLILLSIGREQINELIIRQYNQLIKRNN